MRKALLFTVLLCTTSSEAQCFQESPALSTGAASEIGKARSKYFAALRHGLRDTLERANIALPETPCWVNVSQELGGRIDSIEIGECEYDEVARESVKSSLVGSRVPYAGFESLYLPKFRVTLCHKESACVAWTEREFRRLSDEIEQRLDAIQHAPKKTFISSSTAQPAYVDYMRAFVEKVERAGTAKIQEHSAVFSEPTKLIASITIDRKGDVLGVEINRPSGNAAVDRLVPEIVRLAAPFDPIPVADDTDQLVITRTFLFHPPTPRQH